MPVLVGISEGFELLILRVWKDFRICWFPSQGRMLVLRAEKPVVLCSASSVQSSFLLGGRG